MVKNVHSPTDMAGLYFVYVGATSLERPGTRGITHLMEHLVSKNIDDMQDALQENGVDWNAYTDNNRVVFYFQGLERYLAPLRTELVRRMQTFAITRADLSKEKRIVLAEYASELGDKIERQQLNLQRLRYGYYSPIGALEDIRRITYDDVFKQYAMQYAAPDCIVNVSPTHVMPPDVSRFCYREHLLRGDWAPEPSARLLRGAGADGEQHSLFYERADVSRDDRPVLAFLNELMSGGLNSPLYKHIREELGLVYGLSCSVETLGVCNLQQVHITAKPGNIAAAERALTQVLSRPAEYITQQRLDMVRKSYAIDLEKAMVNRYAYVDDLIRPEVARFNERLPSITLRDLQASFAKYYDLSGYQRTINGKQ